MPLVPTSPSTWPGRGTGKRWSLNEFALFVCTMLVPWFVLVLRRIKLVHAISYWNWNKPVAMSRFFGQVAGQIDDWDGLKRTLLHTNSATNTQSLRKLGNLLIIYLSWRIRWWLKLQIWKHFLLFLFWHELYILLYKTRVIMSSTLDDYFTF